MTARPSLTPAEHIARAKAELAKGGAPQSAIAHAVIAIAELMATNMTDVIVDATTRGAVATADALGTILNVVNPVGGLVPTDLKITDAGAAVVESGLTTRQAHELKTGCSEANPCDECRNLTGDEA